MKRQRNSEKWIRYSAGVNKRSSSEVKGICTQWCNKGRVTGQTSQVVTGKGGKNNVFCCICVIVTVIAVATRGSYFPFIQQPPRVPSHFFTRLLHPILMYFTWLFIAEKKKDGQIVSGI